MTFSHYCHIRAGSGRIADSRARLSLCSRQLGLNYVSRYRSGMLEDIPMDASISDCTGKLSFKQHGQRLCLPRELSLAARSVLYRCQAGG
jgi:hypothetical protein